MLASPYMQSVCMHLGTLFSPHLPTPPPLKIHIANKMETNFPFFFFIFLKISVLKCSPNEFKMLTLGLGIWCSSKALV